MGEDGEETGGGEVGESAAVDGVRCFALTLRHAEAYCAQAKTLPAYCTINRDVSTLTIEHA